MAGLEPGCREPGLDFPDPLHPYTLRPAGLLLAQRHSAHGANISERSQIFHSDVAPLRLRQL
jgi:hypothetical protein